MEMNDNSSAASESAETVKSDTAKKTPRALSISYKVSEKGGLSVYGLGRFPVTLYKEQWKKLLEKKDEIISFLQEHDGELKTKGE
jgi:hypothetical protein